eukprot:scaffold7233_cov570-Prasinococcus_capsulatus_cf.AAC.7
MLHALENKSICPADSSPATSPSCLIERSSSFEDVDGEHGRSTRYHQGQHLPVLGTPLWIGLLHRFHGGWRHVHGALASTTQRQCR